MKLHLIIPTAAVIFSALSGSVSAHSFRGVAITSDSADVDSADYYPEVEDYDYDPVEYYYSPESEDYDYAYEDEDGEEDYPEDVDFYNRARAEQQMRRFGTRARSGSNRANNVRSYLHDNGYRTQRVSDRKFRITGNNNRNRGWRISNREANRLTDRINRQATRRSTGWRSTGWRSTGWRSSSQGRRSGSFCCSFRGNGTCRRWSDSDGFCGY